MTARRTCEQCGSLMPPSDLLVALSTSDSVSQTAALAACSLAAVEVSVLGGVLVLLRAMGLVDLVMSPMRELVSHVLKVRAVAQVAEDVVVTDAVLMAYLQARWTRPNESFHNKGMNIDCPLSASIMKSHLHVAPRVWVDVLDSLAGVSHSTKVRNFVERFPAWDGQPAFSGNDDLRRAA